MLLLQASVKRLLFLGLLFMLMEKTMASAEGYRRIPVYRDNQTITIPCKKFHEINTNLSSEISNYKFQWFNGSNKVNTTGSESAVDEITGSLNLTVTQSNIGKGWYACVVYKISKSEPTTVDIFAIEDVFIDLQAIDFTKLYQQNLIAAIIASTSFVLLVLLAWLIWSYRWQPSGDDVDGKNDSENPKKSSKKPVIEQIVKKAKELARNRRRKGPPGQAAGGTQSVVMPQAGWMASPSSQFAYQNQISSDSETEPHVVTIEAVPGSPLQRQPAMRRHSTEKQPHQPDKIPHQRGKFVEDKNARISINRQQQQQPKETIAVVETEQITQQSSEVISAATESTTDNTYLSNVVVHRSEPALATDADDEGDNNETNNNKTANKAATSNNNAATVESSAIYFDF